MAKNETTSTESMGNFSDLASIKGNTVEKPKNLPDGPYAVTITGPFKENRAKSGNFSMRFPIKVAYALDEAAAAQIAEDPKLQKAMERDGHLDFWMSPDARWRFTDFCKALGIDQELDLISMGEALVAYGQPFMAMGKAEASQNDPENKFFSWSNPAPLPA